MSNLDRKAACGKVLVLGIDGMDPRATENYIAQGIMPNTKKLLERGSANEHLAMLGGHPTGTPPMWTTMATGCNSNVHGITDFRLQSPNGPEYSSYGFDSRRCRAEQLWNVTAEAGLKTLVFHWPGSSWPPTSDSENLHVIDGTQPKGVNIGTATVGKQFFAIGDEKIERLTFKHPGETIGVEPCAVEGLEGGEAGKEKNEAKAAMNSRDGKHIILENKEGTEGYIQYPSYEFSQSPITEPKGWANAPEGAKEFIILMSGGLIRRPALITKNAEGVYDSVSVYKSKKDLDPMVVLPKGETVFDIIDFDYRGDQKLETVKAMRITDLAEDGSSVRIFVSGSLDIHENSVFHPKSLFDAVVENVGYPHDATTIVPEDGFGQDMFDCALPSWQHYCDWSAAAMHYLIETEDYDVVFSQNHNVDAQMHMIVRNMKKRPYSQYSPELAKEYMEEIYKQTDDYIGKFLHFLDEGWAIFLISDHALVCPEYQRPEIMDGTGVHAGGIMRDLGFTVMLKDEDGNDTHEIDWSKTVAVNSRNGNIYLNLKSKYDHGIISDEDRYEVEEEIMTKLYSVKHPVSGKRVFALALRNKDAVLLGEGGDQCGEILLWTAEGYNDDHFDALTTTYGLNHTSLQPLLIAAGKGIKEGELTPRIIRQVDVAPTLAIATGVRMPAQCEGAPAYQLFVDEY